MAQIYKRIYTYTGQNKWTPNERSAAFSNFTVSGDTAHSIEQLVSIKYEHYHSSGSSRDWTLKGRLVLADGTTIDSEGVSQRISKNTVVKFENNFATLPTAEQFAQIRTIQTLDTNGSAANNGVLSWKANSELPIRLIVEFYDTPPTRYAPEIKTFAVERVTSGNTPSPEGTSIATSIKLAFASGAPTGQATVKLYTSTNPNQKGTESNVLSKVSIASLISGVNLNTNIITGTYSTGNTYYFTLEVTIGSETATAQAQAFRAKAPIHITNHGVSFGGFSSATADDPKEEFHNPVVFHKGIQVSGGASLAGFGIQAGGTEAVTVSANSTYTFENIKFEKPFATTPTIVVGFFTSSGSVPFGSCSCAVTDASATQFSLRIYNNGSGDRTPSLRWIAVGTPT